ncbi:uncharacterized protein RSE6_10832 [Rhynchosporium secalis]|uniref:Uncharacterized protein n=1 Tax=Rhynchosporium secalis TaxID=38038 RepID=A0A1E1MLG8_RHYSE|nr:uncharacterized protein RSE6_10832 [Rhynchosporium secalis]
MQYLSEAVFIRSERSFDLLQGILMLLGLYHYHCLVHIQFNNLMQLAVSIVRDMDLNRDPVRQMRVRALGGECEELRERNTDERRAIVGVWYMSSNVALTFNKGQSDKCTKCHEQCLEELEKGHEYESDILLIQLVRIQHLTQRIVDCNNRDQLPDELPVIEVIPTSSYHEASQNELSRLNTRLPSSLQKSHLILNYLNTAHLRLYESPSSKTLHSSTPSPALSIPSPSPIPSPTLDSAPATPPYKPATRFEAAKSEMSAAQGGVWKNSFWDLAAEKLRMKRIRIEKWWGGGREGWRRGNV